MLSCRTMPERAGRITITPLVVPTMDFVAGLLRQRDHAGWRRFACHDDGGQPLSTVAAGGLGSIANSTSLALTAEASAIVRGD